MRIVIWHGYLLAGTGSNVFTRELAREWSGAGHDVTVLSQEPHPQRFDLGGAAFARPDVGGLLPTFVIDDYPGYRVAKVQDLSRAELDGWVAANAAAVRELGAADVLVVNHVLLGGAVGAGSGLPYTVIVHGSELEYSMRGNAGLSKWGAQVCATAEAVVVGSPHVHGALTEVCGTVARVHQVPPGVDVDEWRPQPRAQALAGLLEQARLDPPNPGNANERLPDEGNAARLAAFLEGDRDTVVYFGKLITNKGVQVLIDALRELDARAVIVGFGPDRAEFERRAEGLPVLFTGPFEHRHLVHLLALGDAAVVPSIFPEAFGMVAAEAAAAGCPPVVALHSGLAEVARGLEQDYPAALGHLAWFESGDPASLAARLAELLSLPAAQREAVRGAARSAAVTRWSWTSVAERILAAATSRVL